MTAEYEQVGAIHAVLLLCTSSQVCKSDETKFAVTVHISGNMPSMPAHMVAQSTLLHGVSSADFCAGHALLC